MPAEPCWLCGPQASLQEEEFEDSADDSVGGADQGTLWAGAPGSDSSSLRWVAGFVPGLTMVAFKELSNESDGEWKAIHSLDGG